MAEKRHFRSLIEEKQKRKREKEDLELRNIRRESEVWNYINKKRRRGQRMENGIEPERWRLHFKDLLEGVEPEVGKRIQENEVRIGEEEGENIQEEEIKEVVRKIKKKKAAGVDGIPMETWKFAGKHLWKELVRLLRQIWKEGTISEDWRKGIIVPIYKKEDPETPSNYRGISLLCTAYKIYAEIIRGKLEREVEEKEGLPETQMGFRRGRSTMDGIFVLKYLVQKGERTGEKRRKIYAFFADLRAAFDNVDRDLLWKILRKMKIKEGLIKRIEKIYERTEVQIRTGGIIPERFETRKGVRQGCVLSPLLFNVYIAEVDKEFRNRKIGEVEIGRE